MSTMLSFSAFLALLVPAPLPSKPQFAGSLSQQRRRALAALRLPAHLQRDIGIDDCYNVTSDLRWLSRCHFKR